MTVKEANEALDRLFDYCEEIDNHIPEEERTGYDMLPDIQALRKFISAENKGFDGMTNGEVIQAIFPYVEIRDTPYTRLIKTDLDGGFVPLIREWWEAPYKAESEGTNDKNHS